MAKLHLSKDIVIEVSEEAWWLEDQFIYKKQQGYNTIKLTVKETGTTITIFFNNILYME